MEEHYIWLFKRKENGLLKAFVFSVFFHVLMFAIMATTSIYLPLTDDSERLDVFWLYPSFLLGGEVTPPEQTTVVTSQESSHNPEQTPPVAIPLKKIEAVENKEIPHAPAERGPVAQPPPPPVAVREAVKPVVTVPAEEEEPEAAEEPEMTVPARIEPPKSEVKEARPEPPKPPVEETAKVSETKPIVAAKKTVPEQPQKSELPKKETIPERVAVASPPKKVAEKAAAVAPPQASTAVAEKKAPAEVPRPQPEQSKPVVARPSAVQKTTESAPALPSPRTAPSQAQLHAKVTDGKLNERAAAPVQRVAPPAAAVKPASPTKEGDKPVKSAEVKGLFLPPVFGDLKLEIGGKEEALKQVKVTVLFREFRQSRRNRPMTKAEARRVQAIVPKVVRTSEKTLQAVIDVAGEGVYDFRLEAASGQSVAASFTVKVFEKSKKAVIKNLGSRTVGNKESVTKILMPEGILWDDPAAFTGNIEDSDSVTKFNSDTGLVWKEYN